jgi:hypothetical protein
MFVHYKTKLVNTESIEWVDYTNLPSHGYIRVYFRDGESELLEGPQASDLVMRLCPEALEGERMKYHRHAWAIHNLFGHPLMQIFSWLGLTRLGLEIHDKTVPNPITKQISM